MKFTIDRDIFMENLNIIARGLPSKSPLPILTSIKFEATETDLYMTSNSEITILAVIGNEDIKIEKPGKTVIPGRYLIEFIRRITCKHVTLTLLEDKILVIKSDKGEYNLRVDDYFDYPTIEFVNLENPINLNAGLIKSLVKQTAFAASSTSKKPILTGINLRKEENSLIVTSTDSYRLSQTSVVLYKEYNDFNFTIPSKSFDDLSRCLDNPNEIVSIYLSNDKILFKFKNILFQTRLLDGDYPNTSRLIPSSFPIEVSFNKEDLLDAVERVSLLNSKEKENNEYTYSIIKFEIKKDMTVEISSTKSSVGDAQEILIPNTNDIKETLVIGFSSKYITEALRSFTSNEVTLFFINNARPFIIRSTNYNTNEELSDNLLTQLILPVRSD